MTTVPVGVNVTPTEYRTLTKLATAHGVQVHHLIENLTRRALRGLPPEFAMPEPPAAAGPLDLARLAELHAEGLDDTTIAERMNRPRSSVSSARKNKLHLPSNRKHHAVDIDRLRELHALGLIDKDIAAQLGVPRETVTYHRGRLDLTQNGRPGMKPRRAKEAAA